ncbi:hypothetical protein F5B22DRAFT_537161 [Xylaria bambusicola]|uniref:uncharacterized protein n=1 Tax=Xylaria bambusicola TaxID=326684 RepID=UPI002008B85E|nr:uncharacterized protein F5B22DRAFT_537161 [Xylaria bambusicola]KAI0505112.1 hypothetical protein F5B22DRAFT_537161 [Xylaria bambusicola]
MPGPEVSHGRGGAGNINPDDTEYVDGEIVRQGDVGTHGDGAYSTGRGGSANIADKDTPVAPRADKDVVPVEALRPSVDGEFHTGRGGAANVVHAPEDDGNDAAVKHPPNQGLADKLKHKIFGMFKK